MDNLIPAFTPYIPSDAGLAGSKVPDKATTLMVTAAELTGQLSDKTRLTITEHMAVINSYYSNLIEGNSTQPHDIRQAQAGEFSRDAAKRDLQLESLAHIHVQEWIAAQDVSLDTLFSPTFIQAIHREFYARIPDSLHQIKDADSQTVRTVVPGVWRDHEVRVGQHIAPDQHHVQTLMDTLCEVYHPDKHRGDRKIIAILCAHHRLAWVHPFSDGNGRVIRLFTDAALRMVGMKSSGVWCLSRGLARSAVQYKSALANADATRGGNLDGRGVLSESALISFCEFMLDTAQDQVEYISCLLDLRSMRDRIAAYVQARNDNRVQGYRGLKDVAINILHSAFVEGAISRTRAINLCEGMAERTARRLLAQLKEEGLLSETSSRSDLSWEIPEHVESWYFPELTPGMK